MFLMIRPKVLLTWWGECVIIVHKDYLESDQVCEICVGGER